MKTEQPVIALLGSVDHEGIVSLLKTSGYLYRKKLLESSRENWGTIIHLVEGTEVEAVLAKLVPAAYYHFNDPAYDTIGNHLLAAIVKKPNLVFVHEALYEPVDKEGLVADPYEHEVELDRYDRPHFRVPGQLRAAVNTKLRNAGLELICYSTNAQLTVMGTQFLQDLAAELIFRIYIAHGRLYATEIDKLLQLFKEFLDSTGRGGLTLNKVATEQGTSFEFCGEYRGDSSLAQEFQDFSQFMDVCVSDVDKARTMLSLKNVGAESITKIITRYTKEARRLVLDVTHERETRILAIRQRLESELTDVLPPSTASEDIRTIVDEAIPTSGNLTGLITGRGSGQISQYLTINFKPQLIDRVHGIVVQELNGNVSLGPSAEQLIELIGKYGGEKAGELTNDVHEVGDRGVPEGTRLTKKQRITSFLFGLAPEVAKAGVHLLEEYLKHKMT